MFSNLRTLTLTILITMLPLPGFTEDSQTSSLPRATPESQQVSSAGVLEFIDTVDQKVDSIHSLMIVRNGYVVTEAWWAPEAPETPHVLWSLSKSFTSTAVGLAVDEGKLSIDDLVISFFPDQLPREVSPNLKAMRVRDLLTMSTGHQEQPIADDDPDSIKVFLAHPVPHKPGTHFLYNTPATFMLSAIVQKVTGETVVDYLQPRLFDPLGIDAPQWDTNPQGISLGGYGLYLKTEDIAKFGQIYLQQGQWHGKQLIPAEWISMATSKQVSNGSDPASDWEQGYGFQFWRCRHNAFRGDGKGGQFCVVIPEKNTVITITSDTKIMRDELGMVWEKLLPALRDAALPNDAAALSALRSKIQTLKATR